MIIECPNCNCKFELALNAEPIGKKMRCSECEYMWIYLPEEPAESLQALITPKEAVIEPKIESTQSKFSFSGPDLLKVVFSAVLMLLICITTLLFNYYKSHESFLGVVSNSALKITSVECKENDIEASNNSNHEHELWIKVEIFNAGDVGEMLHKMRFSVYDKDNNFLDELVMDADKEIAANQSESIEGRLNRIPADAMFIVLDIGTGAQIFIRDKNILSKI